MAAKKAPAYCTQTGRKIMVIGLIGEITYFGFSGFESDVSKLKSALLELFLFIEPDKAA